MLDTPEPAWTLEGIAFLAWDLLQHDIGAVSHGDCGFAVDVALDAVDVGADPVRHVGGIAWYVVVVDGVKGDGCWDDDDDESRTANSRETDTSLYALPPTAIVDIGRTET